jgi:hypothetical protein
MILRTTAAALSSRRRSRRRNGRCPWLAYVQKNEKDRKEIVDAMNNFGPSKYRTNPLSYNATVKELALLNPEEVIDALHKVYRAWGTVAARELAQELENGRNP